MNHDHHCTALLRGTVASVQQTLTRLALVSAAIAFLAIALHAISNAWGPLSCSVNDALGDLSRDCAKYRLSESSYYTKFEIIEVNRVIDVSQNGHGVRRVDFACRLKSDPESGELHESDLFSKSNGSWRLAHQ